MSEFIDVHCHWVPGIDDGAKSDDDAIELLRALSHAGFATVVATPHMRPGLFNNTRQDIECAYAAARRLLESHPGLPAVALGCEHFFDDIVLQRLLTHQGVLYPGGKCALIEFPSNQLPARMIERLFDLRAHGIRPVLAHPERYAAAWSPNTTVMEDLVDRGTALLMDVGALAGLYGQVVQMAAERLLDLGLYYAVCSDSHRVADVARVVEGIAQLEDFVGPKEARFLLVDGPRAILDGTVDL